MKQSNTSGCANFFNSLLVLFTFIVFSSTALSQSDHNVLVSSIESISPKHLDNVILQVTNTELEESGAVKFYLRLYNKNGKLLSGAVGEDWINYWCSLSDEIGGNIKVTKDFKVTEYRRKKTEPIPIVLVMDFSQSIGDQPANDAMKAAADFIVNSRDPVDPVSIIKFDNQAIVECPLTTNTNRALLKLQPTGIGDYGEGTALRDAIAKGITTLKPYGGYDIKLLIAYTDGKDNYSIMSRDSLFNLALSEDIVICGITISEEADKDYIRELSHCTGGTYNHILKTSDLKAVYDDIYYRMQTAYIIEYYPDTYGQHDIEINFCMPDEKITAVTSFNNMPPEEFYTDKFEPVYFGFNDSTTVDTALSALGIVCRIMREYPELKLEVHGYTDSIGTDEYNEKLSKRRAEHVYNKLVNRGIDKERLYIFWHGEENPAAENSSEEGRRLNRRVEFRIKKE